MKIRFAILIGLLALFMAPLVVSAAFVASPQLTEISSLTTNTFISSTIASTAGLPQSIGGVELVGQIGGDVQCVAVRGSLAYVGIGSRLKVLDISDLAHPTIVGQANTLSLAAHKILLRGDYAYVALFDGLQIFDISTPRAPVIVGFQPGSFSDIAVIGDYAYAAMYSGLQIFDISTPPAPVEVGLYLTPGYHTYAVAVANGYAYLVEQNTVEFGPAIIRIIDVSNPAAPAEVSFLILGSGFGYAGDVDVIGNFAYIAHDIGFQIIDVTNPTAPIEIGFMTGGARDVIVAGTTAFLTDYGYVGGVRAVDISDLTAPTQIGYYPLPERAIGMTLVGNLVYIAAGELRIIDISAPTALAEVGVYDPPDAGGQLALSSDFVYTSKNGVRIFNTADPTSPQEVGFFNAAGGFKTSTTITGNLAYVTQKDLYIFDVSNPTAPVQVGLYDAPAGLWWEGLYEVVVQGNYAYIAAGAVGLRILDISDPTTPLEIGFFETSNSAIAVAVDGNHAYVGENSGDLHIIDVSDPTAPFATSLIADNVYDVIVVAGYAYVHEFAQNLRIFNVSDPYLPFEVSTYDLLSFPAQLALGGEHLYIVDRDTGLRVLDVSNPSTPVEVGFYVLTWPQYVAVDEPYIYVSDTQNNDPLITLGLVILWFKPPTSATFDTDGGILSSTVDGTTYTFPTGTFTDTAIITHTPRYPGNLPPTGDLTGIDHFFETTAVYSSTGLPAQLTQPYTLTVHYTDQEKGPAIEDTLALYYWDGNQWVEEPSSMVDAANNTVTATPNHLSVWAVLGETHRMFLPLIRKTL